MAKKTFKEKMAGRRQSSNIEDIRPAQRKALAKAKKDVMDMTEPHNEMIKKKDLKRAKPDEGTKLGNKISASDPNKGRRLAARKDKNPAPTKFKK